MPDILSLYVAKQLLLRVDSRQNLVLTGFGPTLDPIIKMTDFKSASAQANCSFRSICLASSETFWPIVMQSGLVSANNDQRWQLRPDCIF